MVQVQWAQLHCTGQEAGPGHLDTGLEDGGGSQQLVGDQYRPGLAAALAGTDLQLHSLLDQLEVDQQLPAEPVEAVVAAVVAAAAAVVAAAAIVVEIAAVVDVEL